MTTTNGSDTMSDLREASEAALKTIGVDIDPAGTTRTVPTPLTDEPLSPVPTTDRTGVEAAIERATSAFPVWADLPAPARGGVVRRLGELLRSHKDTLADLITLEVGKIPSESRGEVQEMIDVCDLAVGLSRQVGGHTLPSERPGHQLLESWQPLGPIAVISAFNFPAAVWSWNTAIALTCGDTVVWKPSERTPLTSLACAALLDRALDEAGHPEVHQLVLTVDPEDAAPLLDDDRIRLVSATGSTRMGTQVGPRVQRRFGRVLLELGGNNAAIVTPSADLDLTVRGVVFAAAGTAGQRCTTLRRLIVHASIADEMTDRVRSAYEQLSVGNPWRRDDVHVGPLIDEAAYESMRSALARSEEAGGERLTGGERRQVGPGGCYVTPSLVVMPEQTDLVREETFAPLLWVLRYDDLDEAIAIHNDVPQGLASSIFTRDVREAGRFTGPLGSDCGIVNVNVGPSGAEVGGAFGGEKATGGGRETGSDAWKAYMRRATTTINHSDELPLAQGVEF
jgi:aldehyde dehydrogenase (NAD+)